MGGINISLIMKKNNIINMSKGKMNNTIKFFSNFIKEFYNSNSNEMIEKLKNMLDIFKIICKSSDNNTFIPPTLINLGNLSSISFKMPKETEEINFIFKGDNDSSNRSISYKFFEKADDKFITSIFEDLFFHNFDKIEKKTNISLILQNKKVMQNKSQKEIFTKIYDNMKNILSKYYHENPEIDESHEEKIYFKFKKINKRKKGEKDDVEEEEEETDKKIFLLGQTIADKIIYEEKNKNKSKKKKNKHE